MLGNDVRLRALDLYAVGRTEPGKKVGYRDVAKMLQDEFGLDRSISHGSIRNWVLDPTLRDIRARRLKNEEEKAEELGQPAPEPVEAPKPKGRNNPLTLTVAKVAGSLGWTQKVEDVFGSALLSGVSKRIAAHAAGLTESDIDSWIDEAKAGREPFKSALRRVRKTVAERAIEVALAVQGGQLGYQARIKYLAAVDPDNWSDKPRKTESEQDRAMGITDAALDEIIAAEVAS
ncbi:MAG: hypothetical protein COA38_20545 [Fluviicola sp.]|nr:MAG: hypothetical protein COA38_20545 [Fluviicola sp.]